MVKFQSGGMFDADWNVAQEGDTIILFEGHNQVKFLKLEANSQYNSRRGNYNHNDFIGKPFGTRVFSRGFTKGKKKKKRQITGHIVMLKPSPELWTQAVPHRTQILYHADISLIVFRLEIKPGDTIIESGTGSGSLSVNFARAVQPTGHVYTFDFNANRVEAAREDFANLKITPYITVNRRDICGTGFSTDKNFYEKGCESGVNAIFLDLPNPVSPLESCWELLNENCKICSFSPCIEQVQRSCNRMRELGFVNIEIVEVLSRHYQVRENEFKMPITTSAKGAKPETIKKVTSKPFSEMFGHTGYLTFARKPVQMLAVDSTQI